MAQETNSGQRGSQGSRKRRTRQDREEQNSRISLAETIDAIKEIAAIRANSELDTAEKLEHFLKAWWSRQYNRPLKDPLLLTYTLEELLYEFYDYVERQKAQEEHDDGDDDRIVEQRRKQALDWAEQEEQRELANLKKELNTAEPKQEGFKPSKDDLDWVNKQLDEAKKLHGESFGEDIEEDFS